MLPKGIKYYFFLIKSRIIGLRLELKLLLVLSLVSLVSIEFILNKIPSTYQWQYDFGVMWLKLCYSYLSALIFYLLVVYLPKERKRVRAFALLNEDIIRICDLVTIILQTIQLNGKDDTVTEFPEVYDNETILQICRKIHPADSICASNVYDRKLFSNTYEFMHHYLDRIKVDIAELMMFNDFLDDDIISNLAQIKINVDRLFIIDLTNCRNKSIDIYAFFLDILNTECIILRKNLEKYKGRYISRHAKLYSLGINGGSEKKK